MSTQPTLGDIVRSYRDLTGLNQQQIADLSVFLAKQRLCQPLDQRRISRVETNAVAPHPATLESLAVTLAHALLEQGYDGSNSEDILTHFRNVQQASKLGLPADLVSLDAELAPYPRWYRDMIVTITRSLHKIISGAIHERLQRAAKKKADIPPVDIESE